MLSYAPGSRAVIRDEEWLIRRIDPANDGAMHLATMRQAKGLSTA